MFLMSNSPKAVSTLNTFMQNKLRMQLLDSKISASLKREHILYKAHMEDVTLYEEMEASFDAVSFMKTASESSSNCPTVKPSVSAKNKGLVKARIVLSRGTMSLVDSTKECSYAGKLIAVVDYDSILLHRTVPLFQILRFTTVPIMRGNKYTIRLFETVFHGACLIE